jgi:cation diffusion facilitator family transporter
MHADSLDHLTHSHAFLGEQHEENEHRTWFVVGLTFFMMVAEIAGGTLLGSLALIADGWHMSTHAAALTISAMAYRYARRHAANRRFAFGTGKLGDLAGYTSAVVLGMIALLIAYESIRRLLHPVAIAYGEAIAIASLGLAVNMTSAWLLRGEHHHHDHDEHHHHGHDLNLRAAYIHVLADAATSILAISGLSFAWAFGWRFIDPLVGLAGTP